MLQNYQEKGLSANVFYLAPTPVVGVDIIHSCGGGAILSTPAIGVIILSRSLIHPQIPIDYLSKCTKIAF